MDRRKSDWQGRVAFGIAVVALICVGVVGGIALRNTKRIDRQEKEDIALSRAAAYRICARNNADRADQQAEAPKGSALRRAREKRIPILDCSPNLEGKRAKRITVDEQRLFVTIFVETGSLPLVENGRVVIKKIR